MRHDQNIEAALVVPPSLVKQGQANTSESYIRRSRDKTQDVPSNNTCYRIQLIVPTKIHAARVVENGHFAALIYRLPHLAPASRIMSYFKRDEHKRESRWIPSSNFESPCIPAHAIPVESCEVGVVPANFDSTSRPALPSLNLRFEAKEAQTPRKQRRQLMGPDTITSCPQWEGSNALPKTCR